MLLVFRFLLPAMQKWPHNSTLHSAALATCKRFAVDATQGKGMDAPREYLEHGLVQLAIDAMVNHPGSRDILYYSVHTVHSMIGEKFYELIQQPQVQELVVTVSQVPATRRSATHAEL